MKGIYFLILLLLLFQVSCSDNRSISEKPDNLIAEEVYKDLIAEFQLIKAQNTVMQPEEIYPDSAKLLIYRKYNITEEQFLQSNEYYQQQIGSQIKRISQVIEELEEEQSALLKSNIDSLQVDSMALDSLRDEASALAPAIPDS